MGTAAAVSDVTRRRGPRLGPAYAALVALTVLLILVTLAWGTVGVPVDEVVRIVLGRSAGEDTWHTIVMDLRLPRAITAALVGAALGVSGLLMQTVFRNALADPFILGISSGASLGVAVVIFTGAGASTLFTLGGLLGNGTLVVAAALGAAAVLALMLVLSAWTRDPMLVLLLGVIVGALLQGVVTIFVYFADQARTRAFVDWGFGSFQRVTWQEMPVFTVAILAGLVVAATATKPLNALLLGDRYARSMGVSVGRARLVILASASVLAGTVVAYAGPIAFLGIAIPHIARAVFASSDHRVLVPASILIGAALALLCGLLAEMPGTTVSLPVNAAAALVGTPVVLWVLLRIRRGVAV
jgi:iron complex transport system permease protein